MQKIAHQQGEVQLQAQEQLLRAIYDGVEQSIFVLDVVQSNFRYVEMNAFARRVIGIGSKGITGKTPKEVFGDEIGGLVQQRLQHCLESNATTTYEDKFVFQGQDHWSLNTLNPVRDETGRIYRIVGTGVDITDRKRAEVVLQESERYNRSLFEQSPVGLALCRMDGTLVDINPAFANIIGRTIEETLPLTYWDITPKKYAEQEQALLLSLSETGRYEPYEKEYIHQDGHLVPVRLTGLIIERNGEPFIWSSVEDITDRKQVEETLRQKAQQEQLLNQLAGQIRSSLDFDQILETAVGLIRDFLKIDRCSFIEYRAEAPTPYWESVQEAKNPVLPSLLGTRTADTDILPLVEKVLSKEPNRVDDSRMLSDPILQQFYQSLGHCAELTLPIHNQSVVAGIVCCAHTTARVWQDEEVALLQAVADQLAIALNQANLYKRSCLAVETAQAQAQQLEHTLQELWRTQSQLVQTEKMSGLGQLVAGVAHEINNPVNFIHGNLTHAGEYTQDLLRLVALYQQHYPTPNSEIQAEVEAIDLDFLMDDLPNLLASMKVGTDRIREIVLALRNFSRMDEAEMKTVNIHDGIDSTLLILQSRLKERSDHPGIQVIKQYGTLPPVECYAGQLNQVFMNILTNAIDALEERDQARTLQEIKQNPSQIRILTKVDSGYAIVRMIDNGLGIPEAVQQRLFDPFFTTKPVGKGTGLGMSISHQIITEKHGGSLRCKSTLGQGAELIIEIPLQLMQ